MSEPQRTTTDVNRGLAWIGAASSLIGILDLVALLIILNNWISVTDYGIATTVSWLFPILDQATDLGLSAAVIQRDDHTPAKISTVFWINVGLSLICFGILAIVAPVLAHVYGHSIIGWMLVAYGAKLFLQNAYVIPFAMLKRELRFKEVSILRLVANLGEFCAKVGFAWGGFGIWCFVLGPLTRTLIYAIGTQIVHPFMPLFVLRMKEAKDYVSFGLKSSGSQILFFAYTNVDYPIVGYFFGPAALGLYKLAYEIVLDPVRMLSNIVVDIAFPAFAKLRSHMDQLIKLFVSLTKLNLITVMMFSAVVFVGAQDVLDVMFPKADGAIHAMRVLSIVAVLRAVSFVVPPLFDGVGKPERTFTYMVCAAITLPLCFVSFASALGPRLGFEAVAVAWAVGYPVAFGVLIYMAVRTLGWTVGNYVRSVGGVIACMLAAAVAAAIVHWLMPHGSQLAALRLVVTIGVVALVSGLLLAYTQGISLRTMTKSLKAPPPATP